MSLAQRLAAALPPPPLVLHEHDCPLLAWGPTWPMHLLAPAVALGGAGWAYDRTSDAGHAETPGVSRSRGLTAAALSLEEKLRGCTTNGRA